MLLYSFWTWESTSALRDWFSHYSYVCQVIAMFPSPASVDRNGSKKYFDFQVCSIRVIAYTFLDCELFVIGLCRLHLTNKKPKPNHHHQPNTTTLPPPAPKLEIQNPCYDIRYYRYSLYSLCLQWVPRLEGRGRGIATWGMTWRINHY